MPHFHNVFKSSERIIHIYGFIYSHVLDIDLWTGVVTETKIGNSISGEVQSCLVAEQFANLRNGDRFWYETSDGTVGFTSGENNCRFFFSVADS